MEIAERRQETLTKLEELKRQRGIAVMEDKDFDQSEIGKLEVELEALDDAQAAEIRKSRETMSLARNDARDKMRGELKVLEATRLGVIQDCNIACRTIAEKISLLLGDSELRKDMGQNNIKKVREKFDVEVILNQLESHFNSVLIDKVS